ncbi:GMC oxidoreductase [Microbacterium sp. NPDC080220]|uniref:GMC oxidoreductase n=1 Tax=Microbacterium sp. NPDC080220 TaxID=3161017 RepID=UPI003432DE02
MEHRDDLQLIGALQQPPVVVVDSQGRVLGVAGLRVADTSMLPWAPSRGPTATAAAPRDDQRLSGDGPAVGLST